MDTSTMLWLTGLVLAIIGLIALGLRRKTERETRFDTELEDTDTWLTTLGKVRGDVPITPPQPPAEPGVVRVAPMTRVDETVAFRYPAPPLAEEWSSRPRVHRFTPGIEPPAPRQETPVSEAVYDLLPTTENFPVITEFTSHMAADTDAEIARRARDMEDFMRNLLGPDAYAYATEAVDRAGGPKAILGEQWTQ